MSVENLKKYVQLCSENAEVLKKAQEADLRDMDAQIAYAKSLGLEFSKEDFDVLYKKVKQSGKDKLSEEDLKKATGGGSPSVGYLYLLYSTGELSFTGKAGATQAPYS